MRSLRAVLAAGAIALTSLAASNAFAFSQALLDLQRQGLIDLSRPHLPPIAQTPCANPGPGRDECIMTTDDGRQVIITSPPLVEGCVEGLVRLRGVWVCRAFLTSTAVAILTPQTGAGGGGGNGGSNGGPGPGGYLGADGQLHVSPSDSSPACDCGRVIGTTAERDAKDTKTEDTDTTTTTSTDATTTTTTSDPSTSTTTTTTTTDHDTNDTDHNT